MVKIRRISMVYPVLAAGLLFVWWMFGSGCSGNPNNTDDRRDIRYSLNGPGDTLVYADVSARFSVRVLPSDPGIRRFVWTVREGRSSYIALRDTTAEPVMEMVWEIKNAGDYTIDVGIGDDHISSSGAYEFKVTVDSGVPVNGEAPDTAFFIGAENRVASYAHDVNGEVSMYFWSFTYNTYTDSSSVPDWFLPDTLTGTRYLYTRVRDNSGIYSRMDSRTISIVPRTFGGRKADLFNDIISLPDGGFAAAGGTLSMRTVYGEPWILLVDSNGNEIRQNTFRYSEQFGVYGEGEFFTLSSAGPDRFIGAGYYTDSLGGNRFAAKLDAHGEPVWKWMASDSGYQQFSDGMILDNGDYIAAGFSSESESLDSSAGIISRISGEGVTLWERIFMHDTSLRFVSVAAAPSGDLAIVAAVSGPGASKEGTAIYVISPAGDSLHTVPVLVDGEIVSPRSLIAMNAGGFALLCHQGWSCRLLRLDENMNVIWTRILNGEEWSSGGSLCETADGGIVAVHTVRKRNNSVEGIHAAGFDAAGNLAWSKYLGDTRDGINAVTASPSGNFAGAGYYEIEDENNHIQNGLIFSFGRNGEILW